MTRQGEKKKKVDSDKLSCMIVDVITFLDMGMLLCFNGNK
jgi:hypothetical protein